MAEVGLQRSGIDAIVGELEPAGVPQHVRVSLDLKAPCIGCPLKHSGKACCREWRPALRDKHEWGSRGFPLELPKGAHLKAGQRMCRRRALLDSTDVQDGPIEVELIPAKVAEFRRA